MMQSYWEEEPWGPWRDNVHAAMVAREVRRTTIQKGSVPPISDWMLMLPKQQQKASKGKVFDFFRSMAKRVKMDKPQKQVK